MEKVNKLGEIFFEKNEQITLETLRIVRWVQLISYMKINIDLLNKVNEKRKDMGVTHNVTSLPPRLDNIKSDFYWNDQYE